MTSGRDSTLAVNATVLTRFSVDKRKLGGVEELTLKSEYPVCRAQNEVFPSSKGVERPIAKYSSLKHVLNVSFWKLVGKIKGFKGTVAVTFCK